MAWAIEALAPYGQTPARHHAFILRQLEEVARGEIDRLMITVPPGHAKTRYASIVFPPWFLAQQPGTDLIAASYNSEYAESVSQAVMRLIEENADTLGYRIVGGGRKLWYTTTRCQYRAAGVGAGVTGRRADCVLIDDPVKSREEADSPVIRERIWSWYRAEIIPRLKPGARIILITTRWHSDDLAGRLLMQMDAGGDQWTVINLPALAEDDDALGRLPGEALWPEWEDVAALERKRAVVGEREWSALYQQRPSPAEGAIFKPYMIQVFDTPPMCVHVARSWDLAGSQSEGADWTVGLKLGRTAEGRFIVLDVIRFRGGPDEVRSAILATAGADGRKVMVRLPEDPGQAGKQQTLDLARMLAGYHLIVERESGSKMIRANPVASQVNLGNTGMVRASWNMAFTEELAAFPFGSHDDQVDALSGAFAVVGLGRQAMGVSAAAVTRMRDLSGSGRLHR